MLGQVMSEEGQIYALKRIKLKRSDRATLQSYKNEIDILSGLRGQDNIIQMVDAVIDLDTKQIHVVMESGEIVLSKWLQRQQERRKAAVAGAAAGAKARTGCADDDDDDEDSEAAPGAATCAVDPNMLRMIWMQMLNAVQTIHEARIVHGDLKSANFVFVEGTLKLIDFGIARTIGNDTTNIVRDSQVGCRVCRGAGVLCRRGKGWGTWESVCAGHGWTRTGLGPSRWAAPLCPRRTLCWVALSCEVYRPALGATPPPSLRPVVPLTCVDCWAGGHHQLHGP
jgi:serine/threonine protein kinase